MAQITLAVALGCSGSAWAQAIAYEVRIEAPSPLADLLRDNLDLLRWRGNARLDREQLQRLVKAAPAQVRELAATEGYYSPKVSAQMGEGDAPEVLVVVDPGPPVLVGEIDLELRGFTPPEGSKPFDADALRRAWQLPRGRVFRQADWESAKRGLLRQVMQARYPRAQLAETSATVDPDTQVALLHVVVDSGPEARFGALRIEGLKRYPASIVYNLNQIHPGDEYSEAVLQSFQGRLQDTGYFMGVDVSADMSGLLETDTTAPAVTLPIVVRLNENKYRNVSAGVGYSTNTGNRAQLAYDDLAVFGLRMKSALTLETRKQSAKADFFYPTTPEGFNHSVGTSFERTDLNGEVTSVASIAGKRAWGTPLLERALQIEYLSEHKKVDGQPSTHSQSLPLSFSIIHRHVDNLVLPNDGYVLNAQVGGAVLPVLTDEAFVRAQARFVMYRPLSAKSTLILRGEAGGLASKQKAGVPSTYLFRAGGDQSVRGYGYQQLGVQEGTAIVGGRYLLTGSAEYDYWFKPQWGGAVFYDAGNAGDVFRELKPKPGYGFGVRWRSPVGPINIDAAYGKAIHKYRLHFSLGFTF